MREQNGWLDDGSRIRGSSNICPNCGGTNYKETLSMESCSDCGLRCDYWGSGANQVYQDMMKRRDMKRQIEEEADD